MKRTSAVFVLTLVISLGLLGCGASKKNQSLTLVPVGNNGFVDLKGIGGTLQFQVLVNDSNQQSYDVTNRSTFTVTAGGTDYLGNTLPPPPQNVLISTTGLMTAVEPFACTWTDVGGANPPAWLVTGWYKVEANYAGLTSNPAYVAVASAGGDGPGGACGP